MILLKPSVSLREPRVGRRTPSGESVFRFFLAVAVLGCVWSTLLAPHLGTVMAWLRSVLSLAG